MEKIVEHKSCKHCGVRFEITDKDLEFYEKVSPVFAGKKYQIPTPTFCPDCRAERRLSFRNERKLYKSICKATGKSIISMYHPEGDHKIYSSEYWWSDKWDALDYGKDFDFQRPFFEQISELYKVVPLYALGVSYLTMENSEYNNAAGYLKDCYMITNSDDDEMCMYGKGINRCKNCIDNLKIYDSENLYQCISCYNCNDCKYLKNGQDCYKCDFSVDLVNCKYCFGCYDLRGAEYYIFNEKVEKGDWEQKVSDIMKKYDPNELRKKILNSKRIVKEKSIDKNENSTGDYLYETSNVVGCYDCEKLVDSKYCYDLKMGEAISENNYDISQFGKGLQDNYEDITIGYNVSKCIFNVDVWDNSSNCIYCICCSGNVTHCFGCVGLKNKSYCILNKQYTKDEYEELVPKIIKHMQTPRLNKEGVGVVEWGEFFPSSISPFGFNETEAYEHRQISREEALKEGFRWSDYESPKPKVDKIIPAKNLPNDINEIPDDILNWAVECKKTKQLYRITAGELDFYRRHSLAVPRLCPDERHMERIQSRNPRKLYKRNCEKCQKAIETTYSKDRPEIVYCEECYNKQI